MVQIGLFLNWLITLEITERIVSYYREKVVIGVRKKAYELIEVVSKVDDI